MTSASDPASGGAVRFATDDFGSRDEASWVDWKGMSSLAQSLLSELKRQAPRLGGDELAAVQSIAQLLARAAEARLGDDARGQAGRAEQLVRLKGRIEERLTDPLLSPARIAADLRISVRKLHALFAPTGESFRQYVLARRLAKARDLLRIQHDGRSVTEVAFSLGFNSLGTFYRAYRSAYGEPPGETRARALAAR